MPVRTAQAVSIAVGLLLVWVSALLLLAGSPAAHRADPACYYVKVWGTKVPAEQVGPVCHDFGTATGCNFPSTGVSPTIEVAAEACVPD